MLPPPREPSGFPTAGLSPQEMTDRRVDANNKHAKATEDEYEHAQRRLDQQTMTRMGQQTEADEMDAMGVPEMSRSIGGRVPPNIGRAGSTDLDEEDMAMVDEGEFPHPDLTAFQDYNFRATRDPETGKLFNPFPKSTMKSLDAAWSLLKMLPYQ